MQFILQFILQTIYKIVGIIITYYLFDCFMYPKKIEKYKLYIGVFAVSIINSAFYFRFLNNTINLLLTIILTFAICRLFQAKLGIKVLLSTLYIIFNGVLESLIIYTLSILLSIGLDEIEKNHIIIYVGLAVFYIINYLVLLFLQRKKGKSEYHDDNMSYLQLAFIPILSMCLLFIVVNDQVHTDRRDYSITYYLVIVLILINVILYKLFIRLNTLYENKLEKKLLEQEIKYKEKYYEKLEGHQIKIRTIRHDMKNQLITIWANLSAGLYDRAEEEIENIVKDISFAEQIVFTKHVGLNAILNVKRDEALKDLKIKCQFEVFVPEKINISEKDIGSLLGNVLDNAIEACKKVSLDKREINLKLYYYNNTLTLVLENSIEKKVETLKTSKSDTLNHGLGLQSIVKVVEKYNGLNEVTVNENSFKIEIVLWNI